MRLSEIQLGLGMAKRGSKEKESILVTTISHRELPGRQQGAPEPSCVLRELLAASFPSSSLSSCPAGLLQNWFAKALDNISGYVSGYIIIIILYYSLKHFFFFSCHRSSKCTLAKEKKIPSPTSFQLRGQCLAVQRQKSCTEKEGRAVLGNCRRECRMAVRFAAALNGVLKPLCKKIRIQKLNCMNFTAGWSHKTTSLTGKTDEERKHLTHHLKPTSSCIGFLRTHWSVTLSSVIAQHCPLGKGNTHVDLLTNESYQWKKVGYGAKTKWVWSVLLYTQQHSLRSSETVPLTALWALSAGANAVPCCAALAKLS